MSERVRTSVLFSLFLGIAACGGGGGAATTKCADGMTSSASCTAAQNQMCGAGQTAMAMCIGGQWSACACAAGSATSAQSMTPGGATMTGAVSVCGNNKAEGDEQCDGTDLKGMSCMTLGMGTASAVLKCNQRCTFDTLMCFAGGMKTSGAGTGAAQGGTGARTMGTMGTAGSGGSGR